jgi:glycosyltransferase involved in cell wall biosynthesis
MRILAVTSRRPIPPDRGDARRLVRFMAELAQRHEVECALPGGDSSVREGLTAMGVSAAPALFSPSAVAQWWKGPAQVSIMARHQVDGVALRWADVIHVSTLRSLAMVPRREWRRVHLDYVDALSRSALERAASSRVGPLWRLEARSMAAAEIDALASVGAASATSPEDAAAIGPSVRVLPVGTDIPSAVPHRAAWPTVTFTGNLGYFANIDAAKWLAREIFPLVRRGVPEARLVLAGARPAPDVARLDRLPGVEVHGDVASLTPYLGAAWVACAPLRIGTGVQMKVLEAAAHERPVVTTPGVAARLTGMHVGRDLMAAGTTEAIADAVVGLIEDEAAADAMGRAARTAVEAHYSWTSLAADLESTLAEVAAGSEGRQAS